MTNSHGLKSEVSKKQKGICPKCFTPLKDMGVTKNGYILWCKTCEVNVFGLLYDHKAKEWFHKNLANLRKGHICNDGTWANHSQKSCLSCGGWDGIRGRGN